jgi:hypothetical protein
MGSSQPGEGDLAHPQATYMSPKLFLLLACLTWISFLGKRGLFRTAFTGSKEMGSNLDSCQPDFLGLFVFLLLLSLYSTTELHPSPTPAIQVNFFCVCGRYKGLNSVLHTC